VETRPAHRQRSVDAAIFGVQMVVCATLLHAGYNMVGAPSGVWAIASAALVVQPGLKDSLTVSGRRIRSNFIGAAAALSIGLIFGDGYGQFLAALILTIAICTACGFDQGVHTACVACIIIMLIRQDRVFISGIERAISVAIGCGVGLGAALVTAKIGAAWDRRHGT